MRDYQLQERFFTRLRLSKESDVFLSICEEKCSYLIRLSYVVIKEDKL
jgi:hypothetical protein